MFDSNLKFIPFTHLLSRDRFRALAQRFGERQAVIDELAGLYESRLSLATFQKLLREVPFRVIFKKFYFINPMYKYKFGLPPTAHPAFMEHVPIIREFMTTVAYCTLQVKNGDAAPA